MNLYELGKDEGKQPSGDNKKIVRQFKDLGTALIDEMFDNTENQEHGGFADAEEYTAKSKMSSESINLPCANFSMAIYQPKVGLHAESLCKPFVAVGGQDCILRIYSLEPDAPHIGEGEEGVLQVQSCFKPLMEFSGHTGAITSLKVYQPKGQNVVVVISGSRDRSVRIWVIQTQECYKELRGHKSWVVCIDMLQPSELEPLVVGGDLDGTILVWSMLRGEVYRRFESATETGVTSLIAYEPKGEFSQLLSGNEDASINVWSLTSGDLINVLNAHTGAIMALDVLYDYGGAVSEDCTDRDQVIDIFVSCSIDKNIIIWNAKSTVILRTISCHSAPVISVKFAPIHMHPKVSTARGFTKDKENHEIANTLSISAKDNVTANQTAPDSDDDDEEEDKPVDKGLELPSGISELSDDLKFFFKDLTDVAAGTAGKALLGEEQEAADDFADVAFMEYVEEVAIISTGKDAKVCVTSLTTGSSLYTLNHHRGAVTGVGTYVIDDDDKDRIPLLRFNIPGRLNLKVISIGTDRQLVMCKLQNFRKSVYDAYRSDKNGFRLPIELLNKIPDKFRPWASVYNQSLESGLTLEEYFSHESFAIFQQAIIDNRPDFIELFLQQCPQAMVMASHWEVMINDDVMQHTEAAPESTNRDSDDDTLPSTSFSTKSRESKFQVEAEHITLNEAGPVNSLAERYITPIEAYAKKLLIGSEKEVYTVDASREKKKIYALHGVILSELDDAPSPDLGFLGKKLYALNRKAQARIYRKKFERPIANTFSLLAVALEMRDVRSITAILSVWLTICNTPMNRSWLDQVAGPFTRLRVELLVRLAKLYPVVFQNFICDLKLQPCHPNLLMNNTTKISWSKEFKKRGSIGHVQNDIGFWHDRTMTELQPMNVGSYIPLAHCADFKLVECLGSVSKLLGDVRMFESEVGSVVIRYLWSSSGNSMHFKTCFWYLLYAISVNLFVMTTSYSIAAVPLSYVVFRRIYEVREIIWSNDVWYFFRLKSLLSFFTDMAIILPVYYRLTNVQIDEYQEGPPWYRFYCSLVVILSMFSLIMKLRPFHSTGPIIATILEIIADIRAYLIILIFMMIAFAVTFWSLCSSNMEKPLTWSNPLLPSVSLNNSREAVENLKLLAPWFTIPSFNDGQYTLGEPGDPFAYSTIQSSFLTVFSSMIGGSFDPSTFNSCGISSHGHVNVDVRALALFYQAIYTILVTIVMVNVLIAIMSDSYSRLSERGRAQVLLNQTEIFGEQSYQFAQLASARAFKRNAVGEPKLMYVMKKKTLDEETIDDNEEAEEGENSELSGEKIAARALLATREFATFLDEQYETHTEELANTVLESMDKMQGLQRDLDVLVRTMYR